MNTPIKQKASSDSTKAAEQSPKPAGSTGAALPEKSPGLPDAKPPALEPTDKPPAKAAVSEPPAK